MKHQQLRNDRPRTCPPWDEWRRFGHGFVAETDAHRLASHLETCNECLALVQSLSDESDTAIELAQSAEADYRQEHEFREVTERLASEHRLELSEWLPKVEAARRHPARVPSDVPNPLHEYLLLQPLGRGSMGCVYKAEHQRLKKIVAVKVLAPKYGRAQDLIDRFEREMQAVGGLSHPNVVAATDAGEDQGHYYLVMEYVDGLDLQTILHQLGPLSVAEACEIMRQACLGLETAHQQGLVHRDIKPSNLLLAADGIIKVLDLGLVSLAVAGPGGERRTSPVGTASYMAPEQWRGCAVDIGADIYSAGCTLFKLLTGRAPFEHRRTTAACRQSHCEEPPPDISELIPTIPPGLASVVGKALAKQREKRFATPAEYASALEPFAWGADLPALVRRARQSALDDTQPGARDRTLLDSVPADLPDLRQPRYRFRPGWILALLLVLGGMAVSALVATSRTEIPSWTLLNLNRATPFWSEDGFRPETQIVQKAGRAGLHVKATGLSLVALGSSEDGTFTLRSTWDPNFENPTGMFFGAEQTPTMLTFYAIQVRELHQELPGTHIHVALHHRRIRADRPGPLSQGNVMLDYGERLLPKDTTDITLETRIGPATLDVLLEDQPLLRIPWAELGDGHESPGVGYYGLTTDVGDITFFSNYLLDLKED